VPARDPRGDHRVSKTLVWTHTSARTGCHRCADRTLGLRLSARASFFFRGRAQGSSSIIPRAT
jgi:hypothetical protein